MRNRKSVLRRAGWRIFWPSVLLPLATVVASGGEKAGPAKTATGQSDLVVALKLKDNKKETFTITVTYDTRELYGRVKAEQPIRVYQD